MRFKAARDLDSLLSQYDFDSWWNTPVVIVREGMQSFEDRRYNIPEFPESYSVLRIKEKPDLIWRKGLYTGSRLPKYADPKRRTPDGTLLGS